MSEKKMLFTDDVCRAAWMQLLKTEMMPFLKDGKVLYWAVKTDKSITDFNLYNPNARVAVGEFGRQMLILLRRAHALVTCNKK